MRDPIKYIYTTTVTGLILITPLIIILIVILKLSSYLVDLVKPVFGSIEDFIGVNAIQPWVWIVLLVVGLFLAGLIFKIHLVRRTIGQFEDRVLSLFPGYRMMKSLARSSESSEDQLMKPALVFEEEIWQPCFIIEETNGLATVFIPEAPNVGSGDIKIFRKEYVHRLPITNIAMTLMIRDYGLGLSRWITQHREVLKQD